MLREMTDQTLLTMISKKKSLKSHCEGRKNQLILINQRIITGTGYRRQVIRLARRGSLQSVTDCVNSREARGLTSFPQNVHSLTDLQNMCM